MALSGKLAYANIAPLTDPRAASSRLQASTAVVAASTVGEEVAVAAVEARQLGSPCCFAYRAAAVKAMAIAKAKAKFTAPPGAGKIAEVSLITTSGSRAVDGCVNVTPAIN
jgi:hypothetical protein